MFEKIRRNLKLNLKNPSPISTFNNIDVSTISNLNKNQLLLSAQKDPSLLWLIIDHLGRLRNYRTASEIIFLVPFESYTERQLITIAKILLSGDQGFEGDKVTLSLLAQLSDFKSRPKILLQIADLVIRGGLSREEKDISLNRLRAELNTWLSDGLANYDLHLRLTNLEFRWLIQTDRYLELHKRARLVLQEDISVNFRLQIASYLRAAGFIDEAQVINSSLFELHGFNHPEVLLHHLKVVPDLFKLRSNASDQIPNSIFGRLDALRVFALNRTLGDTYENLYQRSLTENLARFKTADVYAKETLLTSLLDIDQLELASELIEQYTFADTVLPSAVCKGWQRFYAEKFYEATELFSKALREDPSDKSAATGIRFCYPRAGYPIDQILQLRMRWGYGSQSAGRKGIRRDLGSEYTISTLMKGDYCEGLYSKRHAKHWRFMKSVFGEKFLNFELFSTTDMKDKKLFIIADDGVGDEVRTAQYYNWLSAKFSQVIATCDPRFLDLFSASFPKVKFIPVYRYRQALIGREKELVQRLSGYGEKILHYVSSECLPHLEQSDVICVGQNLFFNHFAGLIPRPSSGAYLNLPGKVDEEFYSGLGNQLKVGLLWRSHLRNRTRQLMYLNVEELTPILNIENVKFISVQHCIDSNEKKFCIDNDIKLIESVDLYNDFNGLSRVLSELDLIVGVSSLPIELGAALGVPVRMLGYSPENYFLRTAGGRVEDDTLTLNSKIIGPKWIDFTEPRQSCLDLVLQELEKEITCFVKGKLQPD